MENDIMHAFEKGFVEVQRILDRNRLLINEISQNHESKVPENLSKNVALIGELNGNIRRVAELYKGLSDDFLRKVEDSSEGESGAVLKPLGDSRAKRIRNG